MQTPFALNGRFFRSFGKSLILATLLPGAAVAQSTTWDSLLSDSYWYVPQENLLSYMTSGTNFIDPEPVVAWDQTLWSLGTSTNGVFTGNFQATFYLSPLVSFTSTNSITGLATDAGQIRMRFQSSSNGAITIGIGQFRDFNGTTAMEMQMITGADRDGGLLVTHWAYMLPYDPSTFTPPDPLPNSALTSEEWAWMLNTEWLLEDEDLFGPGGQGTFSVTDYRNGYFWGPGDGPAGTAFDTFTLLGSATPEGNILFNILDNTGTLTSLTGQISGDLETGQMILRRYEFDGSTAEFGSPGLASVIPEPTTAAFLLLSLACTLLLRRRGIR